MPGRDEGEAGGEVCGYVRGENPVLINRIGIQDCGIRNTKIIVKYLNICDKIP